MKKQVKVMASFGLAAATLVGATQFASAADFSQTDYVKSRIEEKQDIISANPYIPQYKKDIINSNLDAKIDLIESDSYDNSYDDQESSSIEDIIEAKLDAIDLKIERIENDPFIPEYKKDMIIAELELAKDRIEAGMSADQDQDNDEDQVDQEDQEEANIEAAIEALEMKIERIENDPYIPEAKKDIIINELEVKIDLLEQ